MKVASSAEEPLFTVRSPDVLTVATPAPATMVSTTRLSGLLRKALVAAVAVTGPSTVSPPAAISPERASSSSVPCVMICDVSTVPPRRITSPARPVVPGVSVDRPNRLSPASSVTGARPATCRPPMMMPPGAVTSIPAVAALIVVTSKPLPIITWSVRPPSVAEYCRSSPP